jgi:hypothetical protein
MDELQVEEAHRTLGAVILSLVPEGDYKDFLVKSSCLFVGYVDGSIVVAVRRRVAHQFIKDSVCYGVVPVPGVPKGLYITLHLM